MSASAILDISRDAVWLVLVLGGPVMLVALVIGTIVGLFQALTSIQEMTLTFAPKLIAILATLWLLGDFVAAGLQDFLHGPILDALGRI
ncbi:flagellar biosynthesis protein FliQ [Marinivivus vitaminiproducens]|uniref:flagellar biosynthesis protein FliQ n=1 Tax=Marinivivus vitaminiproducens TaxID=3035935 RepID=UPI00279DCB0D|nr:flagellar biosynthesis protein FliQ [Geminicoccaceae bacterium SCSIO 64248]